MSIFKIFISLTSRVYVTTPQIAFHLNIAMKKTCHENMAKRFWWLPKVPFQMRQYKDVMKSVMKTLSSDLHDSGCDIQGSGAKVWTKEELLAGISDQAQTSDLFECVCVWSKLAWRGWPLCLF